MTAREPGRRRRLLASAAVAALLALGGGLVAAGVLAQEPPPPAPAVQAEAPSTRPSSVTVPGHASHGGQAGYREGPKGPTLPTSAPVRVVIPSLDVSSPLERLPLQDDNTMAVPRDPDKAGWYDRSPTPGSLGPAVIAGHVTWNREPVVFFKLGKLRPGQRVEVQRRDGRTAVFAVTKVHQYSKTDFPTEAVYGRADNAALRLITCGGVFDGENNRYLDNVVVFAKLVTSRAT